MPQPLVVQDADLPGVDLFSVDRAGNSTVATALYLKNQASPPVPIPHQTLLYGTDAGLVVQGGLSANGIVQLGPSNNSDDTNTINLTLQQAAGMVVKGSPGQIYLISSALIVYSGTTLDMTGCTILMSNSAASNMLNNAAITPVRTLTDANITATTTTLTSASGNFTSADVGRSIFIAGAAVGGDLLCTTITAVTTSTKVTVATAASTTVTNATATIYNRDQNIRVIGGLWNRQNAGPSGGTYLAHSLRFRHVDGLFIQDLSYSSTNGKYGISVADATMVDIRRIRFNNCKSDGVHIAGPTSDVLVDHLMGTTGDDMFAITTQEPTGFTGYNDSLGPVSNVVVSNVEAVNSGSRGVLLLAGRSGSLTHVHVTDVRGSLANNIGVYITDDASLAAGVIDDVVVEKVSIAVPAAIDLVRIDGQSVSRVLLADLYRNDATATGYLVNFPNANTYGVITIRNATYVNTNTGHLVNTATSSTITQLTVDNLRILANAGVAHLLNLGGTITDLVTRNLYATFTSGSCYAVALGSAATVTRMTMIATTIINGANGGGVLSATNASTTLPSVEMVACQASGTAWLVDVATTTTFNMAGCTLAAPGQGIANIRATAVTVFDGAGNTLAAGGQNFHVTAGGKAAVRGLDLPPGNSAGGFPTIAAGAGAGTGPTVSVAGSDRSGTISVTTGTTPAAGQLCTVTFIGTWPQSVKVVLTPTASAAASANAYISATSTTAFTVSTVNVPSGTLTYAYQVLD